MRLRIASIAFLIGSLCTGVTWLFFQPLLLRIGAVVKSAMPEGTERAAIQRLWSLLPFSLALEILLLTAIVYALLQLTVGRPLKRTEEAMAQLEQLNLDLPLQPSAGPLLSRVQDSLRRMADSLRKEQALNRRQVSDLQRMNDQLARAQTGLVASERLATVGRLAAGVAHEVGNPLSGILGYLSLAKSRAQSSAELTEYLYLLEHEVGRIDQIVRRLLDLGRPSRSATHPVELGPLVRSCVGLVTKGQEFERVVTEVEIPAGLSAIADPGPLSQVVINLLLNAAQAMKGQGRIRIDARRDGERVALSIEDDGPGLTPEARAHLFEPFFTTKEAGKGTGLGLAVSLHLAHEMGGELRAEERTAGARFTLALPPA